MKIETIWPLKNIGDIARVIAGQSPPSSTYNDRGVGLPFYQGKADFGEIYPNIRYWCKKPQKIAIKNDILLSVRAPVGPTNICKSKSCIGRGLSAIRAGTNLYYKYLFYFFRKIERWLTEQGKGSTFSAITQSEIRNIKIPLPPLSDQKVIAEILDRADGLRRKRQQTIDLLDELLRSIFLNMFGDPVKNPKEWKIEKFSRVGTLERGKSKHRPRNDPHLLGGPYPLIQTGDVANSGIYITRYNQTYSDEGLKQSRMWPAGTLCITIAANIADSGILTFDSCFPDSIVGFTPNKKVKTEYIKFCLSFTQKILEQIAPESAQKNINLKILRNLDIPLPPLELQNRFAEILIQVESVKEKMQKSLEEMDNLFHSLMQRAFKGELKLDKVLPDMMATDAETFEELSQLEDNKSAAKSKPNEQKESPPDQWLEFIEETDPLEFPIHDCYKIKEHLQDIKSDEEEPVDIIVFDGDENSNLERIDKLKKIIQEHLEMISDYKGRTFKIITMDYDNDPSLKSFLQTKLKEALQENLEMCRDDKEGPIEIIDYFWDENANNQYIPVYKLDKALQKNMEMIQDEKGRRLKIIDYFFDENANNQDMPFYKLKKTFQENLGMINDDKSSRIKIIKLHCDKNARLKSLLSSPKMLNLYTKMGTNTISRNYLALNKDIRKHIPLTKNKVLQQLLQIVKDDKRLASILAKDFVIYLYLLFGDTPFNFEDIKEKFSNAAKSYEEISDLIFRMLRESLNEEDIYLKQCFFDETFDSGDEKLNKKLRGTIGFRVYENKK